MVRQAWVLMARAGANLAGKPGVCFSGGVGGGGGLGDFVAGLDLRVGGVISESRLSYDGMVLAYGTVQRRGCGWKQFGEGGGREKRKRDCAKWGKKAGLKSGAYAPARTQSPTRGESEVSWLKGTQPRLAVPR